MVWMLRNGHCRVSINHLVLESPSSALAEGRDDGVAVAEEVDVEVDVRYWLCSIWLALWCYGSRMCEGVLTSLEM